MVASELNSDDWTGGSEPKSAKAKSRFEKWTDHHPATTLGGGIILLALLHAADVSGQPWSQFAWRAFENALVLTICWGAFFGGLALSYWLLLRTALVNHLSGAQRRYLVVLAYVAFFASALFGAPLAIAVLHLLASLA